MESSAVDRARPAANAAAGHLEALAAHEARTGHERVLPGEMVVERSGKLLPTPLLPAKWSRKLAEGFPVAAARRHLEYEQLDRLRAVEPEMTLDGLWRWTDQRELVVVPTRVGVSRWRRSTVPSLRSCPHARGGEPMAAQTCGAISALSRRAWG